MSVKNPNQELYTLEEVREGFRDLLPLMIKKFNADVEHAVDNTPSFGEYGEIKEEIADLDNLTETGAGISNRSIGYITGGIDAIVVNEELIEEKNHPVSYPVLGEEMAHWIHSIEHDTANLEWKNHTAMEMIGRVGQRIVADKYDLNLERPEVGNREIENCSRPEEALYWVWELPEQMDETGNLPQIRSTLAHTAGYRAGDNHFNQLIGDEDIISKSHEELREEYQLQEYELEAIEEMMV